MRAFSAHIPFWVQSKSLKAPGAANQSQQVEREPRPVALPRTWNSNQGLRRESAFPLFLKAQSD